MTLSELTATFYGLLSAFTWGAGDFWGGYASRRMHVLAVMAFSQSLGCLILLTLALLTGERFPDAVDLAWASAAGLSSGLGLVTCYRALSQGRMSLAAPVTGVVTAAVPASAGFLLEGPPRIYQGLGFVLAFASIALITGLNMTHLRLNAQLLLSLSAGLCFGFFLVLIGHVKQGPYLYPLQQLGF